MEVPTMHLEPRRKSPLSGLLGKSHNLLLTEDNTHGREKPWKLASLSSLDVLLGAHLWSKPSRSSTGTRVEQNREENGPGGAAQGILKHLGIFTNGTFSTNMSPAELSRALQVRGTSPALEVGKVITKRLMI